MLRWENMVSCGERRSSHTNPLPGVPVVLRFTIAVSVTSGHGFVHDGPVAINPTPTIDDSSAAPANANKRRWRFPGFGRD
jgi:hypothetical protein